MKKTFICRQHGEFEDKGYENPVFYADYVANCPNCKEKCWEITYRVTKSEYDKLEVKPRLFS